MRHIVNKTSPVYPSLRLSSLALRMDLLYAAMAQANDSNDAHADIPNKRKKRILIYNLW